MNTGFFLLLFHLPEQRVFNEMYAKDTSKKIKATWQSKGRSGEHLTTIPPYGYRKDPEDKRNG